MSEHKWADVKGWGGAIPGTRQCDRCNRVASPSDPNVTAIMASECRGAR